MNLFGGGFSKDNPNPPGVDRWRETSMAAGWRPVVFRVSEPIYFGSTLELSKYHDATSLDGRKWDVAFGGSVGTHVWTPKYFSSVEVGLLNSHHILSVESKPVSERFWAPHLTGRILAEKIQTGVRWAPDRALTIRFGLSDVNGFVYWLLR